MKHSKMKLMTGLLLAIVVCLPSFFEVGCGKGRALEKFYNAVVESQAHLDVAADMIYDCWYDAIYENKYSSDINRAIDHAMTECKEDIDFIILNEETIQSLYRTCGIPN